MDICFIKLQDLLALSIAICAWRFAKDKRLSRSEILKEYSVHRQEGRGGDEAPESKTLTGDIARSRPDDPPARVGWKSNKKGKEASQKLNQKGHFTKGEYLQKHKPSDQFSGYMRLQVYYIRINYDYKRKSKSTPP
jgi:hypothetical protein